ncbi:MAG: hypothetical protein ACKVP5_20515 [Aestuariivirga sp.]
MTLKQIGFAVAGLALLTLAPEAGAASKPRFMAPKINLNSVHMPPMRIVRLKIKSRIQVSTPSFTP